MLTLLLAALTAAAASAPAPGEVRVCDGHLLTVERDRAVSAGSKQALRDALTSGADIRVGWSLDPVGDGSSEVIHFAAPTFITIFEGDVFVQFPRIHRQHPVVGRSDVQLSEEESYWSSSLGTNGIWHGRFGGSPPVAIPVRSWWCRMGPGQAR